MIRLAVFGACGRVGTRIIELAGTNPEFQITGAIEAEGHSGVGKKVIDGKIVVGSNPAALRGLADVFMDFTAPDATLNHLKTAEGWENAAFVIGTTGISSGAMAEIEKYSRKMPMVVSSNMSVGMNIMFDVVRSIARKTPDSDIEIIEAHHNQKKDAPSGTALALAKEMLDELERPENDIVYGRKGNVGPRTRKEIGIHAVRAGDIVGDHTVIFAATGERLEITHRASSRDNFAAGALRAAQWIYKKKPGLYSMKDVLA